MPQNSGSQFLIQNQWNTLWFLLPGVLHSFSHWFIQTQFLSTSSVPGTVGELGITRSPVPKHNPLGGWPEKEAGGEIDQG